MGSKNVSRAKRPNFTKIRRILLRPLPNLGTCSFATGSSRRESGTLLAIALTSTRHHPKNFGFYAQLRHSFRLVLSRLLVSPIKTLKNLQSLLMICQWPLDVETQVEDPSWMHIGFTVNAAWHMGLDKPERGDLYIYIPQAGMHANFPSQYTVCIEPLDLSIVVHRD